MVALLVREVGVEVAALAAALLQAAHMEGAVEIHLEMASAKLAQSASSGRETCANFLPHAQQTNKDQSWNTHS